MLIELTLLNYTKASNGNFVSTERNEIIEPKVEKSTEPIVTVEDNSIKEDVEFKHWDKDELIVQTGNGQEFRFSGKDLK